MKHSGKLKTAGHTEVYSAVFDADTGPAILEQLQTRYLWARDTIINDEEQFYREKNPKIDENESALVVTFRETGANPADQDYESGVVTSHGHFTAGPYFTLTMSARAAQGQGMWTAGWLLGMPQDGRWPEGQLMLHEFDIFEILGREGAEWFHVASHLNLPGGKDKHWKEDVKADGANVFDEFNDYTVRFAPDGIFVFFNGEGVAKFPMPKEYTELNWHWLFNLAGGGSWAGKVDDDDLPAQAFLRSVSVTVPENEDKAREQKDGDVSSDGSDEGTNNPGAAAPAEGETIEPEEKLLEKFDEAPDAPEVAKADDHGDDEVTEVEDGGFNFRVDPSSKIMRWSPQDGAVRYNVYRNGRFVDQVTGTEYTVRKAGAYMVQGIDERMIFLARSPAIKVDASGRA